LPQIGFGCGLAEIEKARPPKTPNSKILMPNHSKVPGRCNGMHNPFLPVQRHNGKVPVKVYTKKPLHSYATTIFTKCDVDREKLDNLALGKLHFVCRKLGELTIGNLNVELFEFENL
jgi:hypothetical protein